MKKIKKIWSIVDKVIMFLLITFIIVAIISSIFFTYNKSQNKMVNLFGYSFAYVLTGSMEPTLNVGDAILIKDVDANNIQVDDIVTYKSTEGVLSGNYVTHRVVEINEENGQLIFTTKGDANNSIDTEIITADKIHGVFQRKLVIIKYLLSVFTNVYVFMIFIIAPLFISLFMQLVNFIVELKSDK
jgi:signal peptidase